MRLLFPGRLDPPVVTTLVLCVDRSDDVGSTTGLSTPVVGWEAVHSLVTDVGLDDPEDSSVNCILEGLRVARDLRDENEDSVVAVVSGDSDSMIGADRAVARQVDDLVAEYDPDSAIVVIDSAQDERLVPIVESRVTVDSVDRVVVRQARDIESTYYLLKQFLADEELRQTILVPLGVTLVAFPVLTFVAGTAVAIATITAVIGFFLLYKGFGVDDVVVDLATEARDAVYSGQVSIVTYAVAGGLTLIGLFAGAFGVSQLQQSEGLLLLAMRFAYDAVPWVAAAAMTASFGRLLDEAIRDGHLSMPYLNLPFIAVAMGLVVRGFAGYLYFLERGGDLGRLAVPPVEFGPVSIDGFMLRAGERLAILLVAAVLVALVGVRVSSYLSGTSIDERS
jgi:putative membrane protein